MITIDGSYGEGGGQILRTSLALSMVTGRPFTIEKIRAGRKNPGLLRQHLTAVNAAAKVGQAEVIGAGIGSTRITFSPGEVVPGEYAFAVGTAGSTTLVLQTVLPALLMAGESTHLTLEGGTHNPFAPPFDFLIKSFLPLINRMGPQVDARLERYGFYPAGGGKFEILVKPAKRLDRLELLERGEIIGRSGRVLIANLPRHIAERELAVLATHTSWPLETMAIERIDSSHGPGNIVILEIQSRTVTEVFTGFGEKGVPAEEVAERAVQAYRKYLALEAAVGEYLADQLLIPLAMGSGGAFTTVPLSRHTTTNIEIIRKFLEVEIVAEPNARREWKIEVRV